MDSIQDAPRAPGSTAADKASGKKGASTRWIAVALAVLVAAALALFGIGAFKADPSKLAREANTKAAVAIQALPANADMAATLEALNQIVVPFVAGSNALPPEAEDVLKLAAQKINALPVTTKIEVVGLATTTPKSEPEFRLILERASAVIVYLEKNGVASDRLRALGSSAPLPAGKQAEAYAGPMITFRPAAQ